MNQDRFFILVPYALAEDVPLSSAAARASISKRTMREWCAAYGLGRRIGGTLRVSRVALRMFMEGDEAALAAYLAGDRSSPIVADYYRREGIGHVLNDPAFLGFAK